MKILILDKYTEKRQVSFKNNILRKTNNIMTHMENKTQQRDERSIYSEIVAETKSRSRWIGHIIRKKDVMIKQMWKEYQIRKRQLGRQNKHWKDQLKLCRYDGHGIRSLKPKKVKGPLFFFFFFFLKCYLYLIKIGKKIRQNLLFCVFFNSVCESNLVRDGFPSILSSIISYLLCLIRWPG